MGKFYVNKKIDLSLKFTIKISIMLNLETYSLLLLYLRIYYFANFCKKRFDLWIAYTNYLYYFSKLKH